MILQGFKPEDDFSFSIEENPTGTSGSAVPSTYYDANIVTVTTAGAENNFNVVVAQSITNSNPTLTFTAVNPDKALIDSTGHATHVSNGNAVFEINSGGIGRRFYRTMDDGGSVSITSTASYRVGSLGKHVSDEIDAMLALSTPQGNTSGLGGTQNRLLSCNYSLTAPAAVANPNFFAGKQSDGVTPISWAALGIINTAGVGGGYIHPPVLVTKRHIVGADHYRTGNTVVFMRDDGTFQTTTITASQQVAGDIWTAYLADEITGVTPFKVMPNDWYDYINSICRTIYSSEDSRAFGKIPTISKSTHKPDGSPDDRFVVNSLAVLMGAPAPDEPVSAASERIPFLAIRESDARYPWHSPVIGGDSGSPVFLLVSGEPVLVMCHFTSSTGPDLTWNSTAIAAVMNALAAAQGDGFSYSLARANLSGFTKYV